MQQKEIPVATVVSDASAPPLPSQRLPVASTEAASEQVKRLQRVMEVPQGLAEQFVASAQTFAMRYYIVDNSGSMSQSDGHRLTSSGGRTGMVNCSRWTEIVDSLKWLARVAVELGAYTEFRMLNEPTNGSPQVLTVGTASSSSKAQQLKAVDELANAAPAGRTPLVGAVRRVVDDIAARRAELLAAGKRACVIIASDGEASDGDVAEALRPLRDLPVWVVVRLCTDEDDVVSYWNNVDEELELDLDVLDDLAGEAREVKATASFLTYGLPLHRLREWGTAVKLLDVLDERKLSVTEILDLAAIIFGEDVKEHLPHPELHWKAFCKALDQLQQHHTHHTWDPIRNLKRPWFDTRKLKHAYGKGCCSIM
eukprot:CAMPEP_0118895934 /NCGR_PEP_ID=MMETSP1166-20130328/4046_1 /TAXON_ID=1104430 /ORGANISM="Chrysoreinhardia sp, Strain CCMP3193" /LENGTH=367 /DNA_ID=CAMNT_0006834985 /DNA_START=503 /DNA_END=1606 /DNA_ORIENTATION=+